MVVGELEGAGIQAMQRPGALPGGLWGGPGSCDIYVEEQDLDQARGVLNATPMSEDELVDAEEEAATQLTQPKKGDPIEVPVPKREDIEDLLSRAARPLPVSDESDDQGHGSEGH